MDWNTVADKLWAAWSPRSLDDVRSVLVRVDARWAGLELLTCPQWEHSIVALDATSFEFEVRAKVDLAPWLARLDALEARPAQWRANGWALRFPSATATEAAQACIDELIVGLRDVALALARRLGEARLPIVVLTGLAREVGVVTVSSPTPGLVVPVTAGRAQAYVSLLEGGTAELFTERARQAHTTNGAIAAGNRHAEDQELWEIPERRDGLDLIARHLAGERVSLPAPRQQPPPPRPADPPVAPDVGAALEAALAPELSGTDADELFRPGVGGLAIALQPWGFRLFFSAPQGVLGTLFGRPLARLEIRSEDLKLDEARPQRSREVLLALPDVPCVQRRLAPRVFLSERSDGPLFDVDEHRRR